ncbi:MAG TPA: hypothetical protein VNZ64_05440 [Candidatus Acidoferrum sp.]|jgi:hypothetical protein|nr:hypothetical protein [Candidatus Acidoferrum sp.]
MRGTAQSLGSLAPSPAMALAWEICRAQRTGFFATFGAMLLCAAGRWTLFATGSHEVFLNICILLMSLSLAAVFILFKFTESDRRERFNGFPRRLFTLPVRTMWLATLPMLYGAAAVVLVYVGWAGFILRPANPGHFALGFPSLYLAAGMVCFQAIVWSLAGFPITRLVVLGVWGSALTTSWIAFSPIMGQAQLGVSLAQALHLSVPTAQAGILLALSLAAYGLACWSLERQRRGAGFKVAWPRLGFALAAFSAAPRTPFSSPRGAQLWFEWRRNGMVLPLITGALLMLIVAPFFALCPFLGRAGNDTVLATLCWTLVLPFALAFIIGPGFGKTNFWGQGLAKDLGLPLFLAVRPLRSTDWLGVKLKTAALSAGLTWLLVGTIVSAWLLTCSDCGLFLPVLLALPPPLWAGAVVVPLLLLLSLAMLVTWRLLMANLYLGVLGNRHLFNASFCFVFVALFAPLLLAGWYSQHSKEVTNLSALLPWVAWGLALLVLLKLGLAIHFFRRAKQRGLVSTETGLKYFVIWIWGTEFLLLLALLAPAAGTVTYTLALLAFLALPLARVSLAPLAFARSRFQ